MKKQGFRIFLEISISGILLLVIGVFAVKYYLCEKEYAEYKNGIFSRSYESLVSVLSEYYRTSDSSLSSQIAFCFSNLPLSAEEESSAAAFCSDIYVSKNDNKAAERAGSYCSELLRFLSQSRSSSYMSGWRASGLGIPSYPEESGDVLPTVVMPTEPNDNGKDDFKKAASALLGEKSKLKEYSYRAGKGMIFGFRTAQSYAEYSSESGRLIKALINRKTDTAHIAKESDILSAAEAFLSENGYPEMTLSDSEYENGAQILYFNDDLLSITIGITSDQCELCLFLVSEK